MRRLKEIFQGRFRLSKSRPSAFRFRLSFVLLFHSDAKIQGRHPLTAPSSQDKKTKFNIYILHCIVCTLLQTTTAVIRNWNHSETIKHYTVSFIFRFELLSIRAGWVDKFFTRQKIGVRWKQFRNRGPWPKKWENLIYTILGGMQIVTSAVHSSCARSTA